MAALLVGSFLAPIFLQGDVLRDLSKKLPVPDTQQAPSSPVVKAVPDPQPQFQPGRADYDRRDWSWSRAKHLAVDVTRQAQGGSSRIESFYCGCAIDLRGQTGGDVDMASCGYVPRKNAIRAERLEWEHVMPAATIGQGRACWVSGDPACVERDGTPFKGRSCCMLVDPVFIMAASDPVNLRPSIGEVNGDRSNFDFAELPGEPRDYGRCDMEIDSTRRLAEPPPARRGDIARIWTYMSRSYGITVSSQTAALMREWMALDPVSAEEVRINAAIAAQGHRPNPFVPLSLNEVPHDG